MRARFHNEWRSTLLLQRRGSEPTIKRVLGGVGRPGAHHAGQPHARPGRPSWVLGAGVRQLAPAKNSGGGESRQCVYARCSTQRISVRGKCEGTESSAYVARAARAWGGRRRGWRQKQARVACRFWDSGGAFHGREAGPRLGGARAWGPLVGLGVASSRVTRSCTRHVPREQMNRTRGWEAWVRGSVRLEGRRGVGRRPRAAAASS